VFLMVGWGLVVGVGVLGREYFCCILCLSQDRRVWGILLLYAVFTV